MSPDNSLSVLLKHGARSIPVLGVLLALCSLSGCRPFGPGGDPGPSWGGGTKVGSDGVLDAEVNGEIIPLLRKYLDGATSGPRLDEVFYVSLAGVEPPVPVMARIKWGSDQAWLVPTVPLTRGKTYTVVFDASKLYRGGRPDKYDVVVPKDGATSVTEITGLYPSQERVPANLLKFYVHFSEPMAEGHLFQYARLLDGAGKPVKQAFREVELWEDHHRRVTLWINPGRTKQALGLSESLGPVLEPDHGYTLEIGAGLPDEKGRSLAKSLRHPFRTAGFDREQPSIEKWQLAPPKAGTDDPLSLTFNEPLDHALAADGITVETGDGQPVAGTATVDPETRRWSFQPGAAWKGGYYQIVAAGVVEDLAGNSLYRPFETTTGQGPKPSANPPDFRRDFTVE